MGTRIEIPTPGANCNFWQPPAETPLFLYGMFWDMEKGDNPSANQPPNGEIFRIPQTSGVPCDYKYESADTGWIINFSVQVNRMGVDLRDQADPNKVYFLDWQDYPPLDEYHVFVNDYLTPVNNWGCFGYFLVFWMEDISSIAEEFGLLDVADLLFEMFPAAYPCFVFKYCSRTLRTNVCMKKNIVI